MTNPETNNDASELDKFIKEQKPLDADFDKILNDNAWDLYEKVDASEPVIIVPREYLENLTKRSQYVWSERGGYNEYDLKWEGMIELAKNIIDKFGNKQLLTSESESVMSAIYWAHVPDNSSHPIYVVKKTEKGLMVVNKYPTEYLPDNYVIYKMVNDELLIAARSNKSDDVDFLKEQIENMRELASLARGYLTEKPSSKVKANIVLLKLIQLGGLSNEETINAAKAYLNQHKANRDE